jgi:hypothetical protein
MAVQLNADDKFLILSSLGSPDTANKVISLLSSAGGDVSSPTGPVLANQVSTFADNTGTLLSSSPVTMDSLGNISNVLSLNIAGGTSTGIFSSGTNLLDFESNGVNTLRIDTSGNLLSLSQANLTYNGLAQDRIEILKDGGGSATLGFQVASNTGTDAGFLVLRKARGTLTSPTAVQTADNLGGVIWRGYNGTTWNTVPSTTPQLSVRATENWGSTANGHRVQIATIANGTTTSRIGFYLDNDSTVHHAVSGGHLLFDVTNTADIGATGGTQPRNIYAGTSVLNAAGTAGSPSYSFNTNSAVGLYSSGTNILNFSTSGTIAGQIDASQQWTIGTGTTGTHRINSLLQASSAGALTLTNGPGASTGNPAVYLTLNINGTNYVIPAWTF